LSPVVRFLVRTFVRVVRAFVRDFGAPGAPV
jgi:hypothetical protein